MTLNDVAIAAERWLAEPTRLNADRLENLITEYRRESTRVGLTPRQKCALTFIRRYFAEHGIAPSYEEIIRGLGLKSKSGAHRLIIGLETRGHIRRLPDRARAIEVIDA